MQRGELLKMDVNGLDKLHLHIWSRAGGVE